MHVTITRDVRDRPDLWLEDRYLSSGDRAKLPELRGAKTGPGTTSRYKVVALVLEEDDT